MFSSSSNPFSDVYGFIENSCVEKQSFSAAKLTVKLGSLIQGHDSFSLPPFVEFSFVYANVEKFKIALSQIFIIT